jgi:ribosomal protein L18E
MYVGSGNPNAKSIIYDNVKYDTKKEMTRNTGISLYKINRMIETKEVVVVG